MRSVSQSFGLRRKHAAMAPLKRPPNDGRRMMAELLAVLRGLSFGAPCCYFLALARSRPNRSVYGSGSLIAIKCTAVLLEPEVASSALRPAICTSFHLFSETLLNVAV
jgi:hypothetical protein